jgi:hypothetical protein
MMTTIGVLFLVCSVVTLMIFLHWHGRWNHPILIVPLVVCGMLGWGKSRNGEARSETYESIQQRAERILNGEKAEETSEKSTADQARLVAR